MSSQGHQKILVTGANGQLGSELKVLAKTNPDTFTFVDVAEMDLTSEDSIRNFFSERKFDIIVNCAAYTAVDLAEKQPDLCFAINARAVELLVDVCRTNRTRLIHISTDYVFDGTGNLPLTENATPSPISVYGHSKLEGERLVLSNLPDAYVLRTAWVYSTYGKNFVKTISRLARERESLNVIYDQIGSPTYAADLAEVIVKITGNIKQKNNDLPGLYHYSNEGAISWFDFAYFILKHANVNCRLNPIRTAEYKTDATRPQYSVLDKTKIKNSLHIDIPHWHDSLVKCLGQLSI